MAGSCLRALRDLHYPAVNFARSPLKPHLQSQLKNVKSSCLVRALSSTPTCQNYDEVFRKSIERPDDFWAEAAEQLVWTKKWSKVLDNSNPPFTKWFVGGELNTCYNALDRHVELGRGDQTAIIHDSPVTQSVSQLSYKELLEKVSLLAGVLRKHGVQKGDRVLIYMPMIPEAVVAMLASARVGAIHSLVFGGFASKELSTRINHAQPKIVISANCGVEPTRVVPYKPMLDAALDLSEFQPPTCIIFNRPQFQKISLPLEILDKMHVEVLIPATVQEKSELIHLQDVAWRRLIMGPRKHMHLDDGGHGDWLGDVLSWRLALLLVKLVNTKAGKSGSGNWKALN